MCDQEQGESSLGEVETDSLDVSRILEECADSDISELSQRAITDLDAEIHRLLGAESTSSEEETESRLSQASVSSIVFEEAASTLRRKQSSSPEQPKSSALYILYGPETESSSSQSAPESAESEDEMSADQVMVAIHSGPLETGTDKIAINTGTNTEVQFQGSDDDCRYEFEDSNSTECSPRPLADELEEVANKGTDPMSNQELDLNTLATSASSSSDELSSSGIDSEEEEIFTTTNTKDPHTLSTLKQQASYTPHDSVSEISPGQLALDMLATTDTEELSNVTSESDGEIIPMSAVGVHTMQEGTVTVQGAMHEGMIPVNLEMLATTDSEMDSDLSRSEIELPFQKSHSPHTLSTLKQQASYTPHDSVSEISPGQLTFDMLATTDTEELSNVTSESDGEIIPMSAVGVHTMQEGTVTVQGAIHEGMIPVNLEMLATTDSEMDSDLSWSEKELPFQKSLCRDSSVSRGGTQTDGYREKSHNRTFVHTSELAELKTVHSNAPIGITLEMLAMPESDSSTVTESNDEEMYTAPSNLSEVCTEVATANPEINPKANGEHYNADTNHSGGEMAQDRHVQEISESEEGENTQLPPSQPENEDLKSFSSKSKTIANGSVKHLHVKEDVDGIDLEFQLGDTDTCPVLVPHPSSCSLPSDVQPASAACSLHAPVNEDLQQGHSPGIPELLRKIAELEWQQSKLERAFQEERASLWDIIDRQTQLIQGLHTARLIDRKRIRQYHRSVNQKLEVVEGGVVKVGRECAELQSRLTIIETMRSSVERRRAAVEEGSETSSCRGRSISLLSEQKVTKLKKFFGDNPPVLGLFLKRLGYEQYYPRFLNERIGLLELPHITEEQLIALGIPMGPRLRIMHEAQLL